ncbi:MAG: hypothetical protein WC119_02140 [Synergistaceae bacterium]
MIHYIIPARRNSVGVSFKNRILLSQTTNSLPRKIYKDTIVSTDDEFIIDVAAKIGMNTIKRSLELSKSDTPIKIVIEDVIDKWKIDKNDDIVMLYLVYPNRKWKQIKKAYEFYKENNAKSLLCCYDVDVHPCLTLFAEDNYKGIPIISHEYFRRQDYPKCFNLSHYVSIFNAGEINNLNSDLYNGDTVFYHIDKPIDIDSQKDMDQFKKGSL